ncbi:hypothetical protein ABZ770_36130 [Streptomyces sp. NPDC006654]|uniref:hypothetical protein n=1 Tax=Streptomyces sp. NPDC006654 TaxID=3156897 RepID=UPI00340ECE9C
MTEFPEHAPADRMGVLLAAYQYELGSCFRCSRQGVQVARIGEITTNQDETPLYACRRCVHELLTMHDHDHSMERMDGRPRKVQIPRTPRGAVAN